MQENEIRQDGEEKKAIKKSLTNVRLSLINVLYNI
jgi:hypothetical protein